MAIFLINLLPKVNGKAPIMGRITLNRTMAQFGCKLSCTPKLWNPREISKDMDKLMQRRETKEIDQNKNKEDKK